MKKIIVLCLAAILIFTFVGCNRSEASSTPESSISESSAPEVINTAFARSEVLASEIALDASMSTIDASEVWAREFVEKNYADYSPTGITAVYATGYEADAGIFAAAPVSCNTLFVLFSADDTLEYPEKDSTGIRQLRLQVVFYHNGTSYVLSGFTFGEEDYIDGSAELVSFLSPDNRLEVRAPAAPVYSGAEAYNLSSVIGCSGNQVRLIDSDTAAVIDFEPLRVKKEYVSFEVKLYFVKLSTMKIIAEKTFDDLYAAGIDSKDGKLFFNKYIEGEDTVIETYSPDGKLVSTEVDETAPTSFAVGSYEVVAQDSSLWLNENGELKLLVQGVPTGDESVENIVFNAAIDDHRFIYARAGYEWVKNCAVYDLATGTETKITADNADSLYFLSANGETAAFIDDDGALWSCALSPEIGACKKIYNGSRATSAYNAAGGKAAATEIVDYENGINEVYLIDLKTGETEANFSVTYGSQTEGYVSGEGLYGITLGHAWFDSYLFVAK